MAESNFQDAVVLNGDSLSFRGEQVVIGTGAGSKSLVLQNDAGAIHLAGNPAGTVTVVLPAAAGTIAFKSDVAATAAIAAGTQTATSGTVVFSDSNGISFGMAGSSRVTASYTVPSTAGLLSAVNISAGTTSNNLSAVTFSNSNGISFGLNGSVVTASVAAAPAAGIGAVAAGTQTATSGTVVFSDSNGISFGLSGSSRVTASYTVPSTAGLISAINVSAGTTSNTLTAVTFSNANGVSFGLNASTVTGSVAAGATATGNFGAVAAGTQTATSGTVVFSDSNGISFGLSGSSRVTASYTVPSTAGLISAINVSAGTTSNTLTAVTFANANGVSFGLNASTVTGSVAAGATATGNLGGLSFPGAAAATLYTAGTITFPDTGQVSWQTAGGSVAPIPFFRVSGNGSSVNASSLVFTNSNNVTLGLSTAAGLATLSASIPAGATATGNLGALAAGTQTATSGTLVFSDSNGVTFGMSGSTRVTASVGAGATATGNVGALAAGTQTGTSGTFHFKDNGNVTFGMNASSQITATVGAIALSVAGTQGVETFYSGGTVTLSNYIGLGGNIAWNTSAGGELIGFAAVQVNASTNFFTNTRIVFNDSPSLIWNTALGPGVVATVRPGFSAGTTSNNISDVVFSNANGVSFGLNGSTITASVNPGGGGGLGAVAAGTQTATSGTVVFSDSNGVTFGMSGSTRVTASVGAGATATGNFGALAAGTQTATSGTIVFSDSNGISFGLSGSSRVTASYTVPSTAGLISAVNVSAGTTSNNMSAVTFSNANGVSFGLNGSTITASVSPGGGGGVTLSSWDPWPFVAQTGVGSLSLQSNTSGAMSLFPFKLDEYVAAEAIGMVLSASFITGSTNSYQQSGTLQWGLFTRATGANSTQLSLAGSNSLSYAVTYTNSSITVSQATSTGTNAYTYSTTASAGLNISSGYTGLKLFNLVLGSTVTPGAYWLGMFHRNSTVNGNSGIRLSLVGATHSLTGLAPFGSFSSAHSTGTNVPLGLGGNFALGQGSYTVAATVTAMPSSITMSQITQAGVNLMPYARLFTRP